MSDGTISNAFTCDKIGPTPIKREFRIHIVRLVNHKHSHAFDEVAMTVHEGLRSLGYIAHIGYSDHPDHTMIVFGAHLLDSQGFAELPGHAILYNLEQTTAGWVQDLAPRFKSFEVWDYSERNVVFWASQGVNAKYVPIGFHPVLFKGVYRYDEKERDIDVLFYGYPNARRTKVLSQILEKGLSLVALTGTYGVKRDSLIARAKVVLNIHFYDPAIFEIARCSYLWANGVAVVSEKSIDDAELIRAGVMMVEDYGRLAELCEQLVRSPAPRHSMERRAFSYFSEKCLIEDILQKVL